MGSKRIFRVWLKGDGSSTASMDEVAGEFVGFFQNLFGKESTVVKLQADWFAGGPVVTELEKAALVMGVSNQEIKEALWDIGDTKALGLDGYSARFFKATWNGTGGEVCAAVKEFFQNGRLLRQLNHTVVSLIPKKEHPTKVEEFRPISCYNVIYKIISKVMTRRLGPCLPALIDPAQAGFVTGENDV